MNAVTAEDVLDTQWDARTKVHEYGGAAAVVHDSITYFSHFGDNRVYMKKKGSNEVKPITPGLSPFLYYPQLILKLIVLELQINQRIVMLISPCTRPPTICWSEFVKIIPNHTQRE